MTGRRVGPALFPLTLPAVPPPLPLRIQLQADGGSCREATFSSAGVSTSAPGKFIATSD